MSSMRIQNIKSAIISLFFIGISALSLNAQDNDQLNEKIREVKFMYENDLFYPAQVLINDIVEESKIELNTTQRLTLEAYNVLSSICLNKPNIDALVLTYKELYPQSHYISEIEYMRAQYYFDERDYAKALKIYDDIVHYEYSVEKRKQIVYNRAFCNLRAGEYNLAEEGFEIIIGLGKNKYYTSANYYLAYIDYLNKDFSSAIKVFSTLTNDHSYSLMSRYFMLESYFMLENHNYVIDKGPKLFDDLDGDYKNKVARFLSESFYALDMKRQAKDYLDLYTRSGIDISRKDSYYSGIVSYSLGAYYSAIDEFKKVLGKEDTLSHNAQYYLGNSYLKIKNKYLAFDAFRSAAYRDEDARIKEDSYFKYAKLAFDINDDITIFSEYLTLFPKSQRADEIYTYIGSSYLLAKKYKESLEAYTKVLRPAPKTIENIQKAAFFRAMHLLEGGYYNSAIADFELSLTYSQHNEYLKDLTNFWLAEAHYRTNNYLTSITILERLLKNPNAEKQENYELILYNLAYSFYNDKQYKNAIEYFRQYLATSPSTRQTTLEAKVRVADSHYMLRDFEGSAALYEDISNLEYEQNKIYANYYAAISYGLISQYDKKVQMLEYVQSNKSKDAPFYTQSIYELGRTYTELEMNEKAIKSFLSILNNPNDALYHPKVMIELGLVHYNLSQYDQALKYYGRVVDEYELTDASEEAILGIESVYLTQNEPEKFLGYLDSIGLSYVRTNEEKEEMLFNACEQAYISKDYLLTIEKIDSFLELYPSGNRIAQAYFYKGESFKALKSYDKAAEEFLRVMQIGEGSFKELSSLYYADIAYELEEYDKAIKAYLTLSQIAKLENNRFASVVGLMRSYYKNKDYMNAIKGARSIINIKNVDLSLKEEAQYITATSLNKTGDRENAMLIYRELSKNPDSPIGAESYYMLVLEAYETGEFEKVETLVYDLSEKGISQLYWLAKSFIVLGDAFAEREDYAQAMATFESIQQEYEPVNENDDVLEQVNIRINRIQPNLEVQL